MYCIDRDLYPIIFADDTSFIFRSNTIIFLENPINPTMVKIWY